ncbi:MFS transporter [Tenggerimyces flavus]|uniref:MFS transporter n=1 Tax=Tenggerimyces flavus TaxID=1708749 RepID=A0ABV7YDW9_9ACTN|nr:MFS transporter [Tenggerimyces flavus]MBM7787038.1 DHA2 family multidrug resistance protein-like MFS transporter [Tenggerimyces flavus]
MSSTVAPPVLTGTPRRWLGLAVLALPILLLALDNSVLFLAGPQLAADLRPSGPQLLWILDVYGFLIAGFLVTMGGLADRIGARRLILVGAVAFGALSILGAYSTSAEMLIVSRALLGVAAATLMPASLVLVRQLFTDPRERGLAFGIWTACFSGGTVLGPVVGGALLESFWWGSVFLLGVPVMVLLLVLGPIVLPEVRNANTTSRIDLVSVALSLGTVLPAIYGLKQLAEEGPRPIALLAIAAGLILGWRFVRRQRRLDNPLLDVRLFASRSFCAALGMLLVAMMVLAGGYLYIAQYLQLVDGLSPLRAGLWMMPAALSEMAVAVLAPLLARRLRPAYVAAAGLAVTAVGLAVIAGVGGGTGLGFLIAGAVLVHIGAAPTMVLSTDIVVASAPPEKAGSAGSMLETSGEFGVAVGIAALGALGTFVYRDRLVDTMPAGLDEQAAEASQDTLASATEVAERLPADTGPALLDAAREAFVDGMQTVAGITAVVVAALAVVAVVLLRRIEPTNQRQEP